MFQKLTKAELTKLEFKSRTTKATEERRLVESMQEGDSVLIKKADWQIKTQPTTLGNSPFFKKAGKQFTQQTLKDESGWVLTRLR